jgi:hypothetical protein
MVMATDEGEEKEYIDKLYKAANVIPDPETVNLYKKYVAPALTWIGAAIVTALMMWYVWDELMIIFERMGIS